MSTKSLNEFPFYAQLRGLESKQCHNWQQLAPPTLSKANDLRDNLYTFLIASCVPYLPPHLIDSVSFWKQYCPGKITIGAFRHVLTLQQPITIEVWPHLCQLIISFRHLQLPSVGIKRSNLNVAMGLAISMDNSYKQQFRAFAQSNHPRMPHTLMQTQASNNVQFRYPTNQCVVVAYCTMKHMTIYAVVAGASLGVIGGLIGLVVAIVVFCLLIMWCVVETT